MSDPFQAAAYARDEMLKEMSGVRPADEIVPIQKDPPVNVYVRNLSRMTGKQYYTTQEVADALGVSAQAIRKYSRPGKDGKRITQAPSYAAPFGKGKVFLYTDEDIEALREWIYGRAKVYRFDDLPQPLKEAE